MLLTAATADLLTSVWLCQLTISRVQFVSWLCEFKSEDCMMRLLLLYMISGWCSLFELFILLPEYKFKGKFVFLNNRQMTHTSVFILGDFFLWGGWEGFIVCVCVCSFQVQWSLDIRSPSWSRWLGWVVCFGRSGSTAWMKMSGIAGRFGTAVLSVIWLVNTFPLLSRASRTHIDRASSNSLSHSVFIRVFMC